MDPTVMDPTEGGLDRPDGAVRSQQPDDGSRAGHLLIDLAKEDASEGERRMLDHEKAKLDDCFAKGRGFPTFRKHHIESLRVALKSAYWDMARSLLDKDDTYELLAGEPDILQAALSSQCSWHGRWNLASDQLVDILELLVSHGASVNTRDGQGNAPLYYTCTHGHIKAFKSLVELGADYTILHDPLPNSDVDRPTPEQADLAEASEANLLDIALEAHLERENGCSIPWIRSTPMERKWGDIIMFLLEAGLTFHPDDPRLIKFLHIACFQGKASYVKKLLGLGVDQNARAARGDSRDGVEGSCLHAAVCAGQRSIVECLLQHGAVASLERLCTSGSLPALKLKKTPVAHAVDSKFKERPRGKSFSDALGCCELLVEAGASKDDCTLLLQECAKTGDLEVTKRLLGQGIRLDQVPYTGNLDVIKLLLAADATIDSATLQRQAVGKGDVEILRFLVERDGPLLKLNDFGYIAFELMRGKGPGFMDTLEYLITEYGHDVNATFPGHPNATAHVNLLQRACEELNLAAVRLLSDHGAKPECPGLAKSAFACIGHKRCHGGHIAGFGEMRMPILQLLVKYSSDDVQAAVAASLDQYLSTPPEQESNQHVQNNDERTAFSDSKALSSQPRIVQEGAVNLHVDSADPGSHNFGDLVPWVEETTEAFHYDRLQGPEHIRLLELEQSESTEDPVRCRLLHVARSESPRYEVLSCDWQYETGKGAVPISLNGQTFEAPSPVWEALHRVRVKHQPRLLWVDAICINQQEDEGSEAPAERNGDLDDWVVQERNQQVSQLRDVYQGASRLLVWIGKRADDSDLVFEHLDRCRGHRHLNWCQFRGETETAFRKLCQRPWFYRAWSAQEIVLGEKTLTKDTIIICGRHESPWEFILKCTSFMQFSSFWHPREGPDGRTHLSHLRDLARDGGSSLRNVFIWNKHCRAYEPRDKVFGLSGLDIGRQLNIPIDYRTSVAEVYRNFTQKVIETTQDLDILHWLGPQRFIPELPSWVPDYSISSPVGVLPGPRASSIRYPGKLLPGFSFPYPNALAVRGRYIEKIGKLGDELAVEDDVGPGKAPLTRVLRGWEDLAGKLANKRLPLAVADAFSDTLVCSDESDRTIESDAPPFIRKTRPRFSSEADGFDLWYRKYGTGMLRVADPDYFEEIETIKAWMQVGRDAPLDEKELEANKERKQLELDRYARRMEIACYGRRFFTTDQGSMGLAPPRANAGDVLVFFPGGKYPFALRPRDDGTHEMVGDCFLYDFDVFGLFQSADVATREFVLT